jgi:hypothetical protein
MGDMRHYKRYAVKCSGNIIDSKFRRIKFRVNNISACGISVSTDREVEDAEALTIYFDITGILLPHTKHLKGKVVRRHSGHSSFNYGIRFLDLTHLEIVEIDEYLRYSQKNAISSIPPEDSDRMAFII